MMKSCVLTICSINYINKAIIFFDSFKKNNPACEVFLILADRKITHQKIEDLKKLGIQILWVEDLGISNLLQKAFCFDIIEFNTNIKPRALQLLLETYEKVIYFDPDICVFNSVQAVLDELEPYAILLTPHYLLPIQDSQKPNDWELLKFGVFNLGFIAVKRHPSTTAFLQWWSSRCLELGFYEPQSGLAVDQKWISLAPGFFEGIKVSRNLGLNAAFWNLHERHLSFKDDSWWVNQTTPLIFMHFSSFDDQNSAVVARKQTRVADGSRPDFEAIAAPYRTAIQANQHLGFEAVPYGFSMFTDGQLISPTLRRLYAALLVEQPKMFTDDDPFQVNSDAYRFAVKHHLFGKPAAGGKTFRELDNQSRVVRWALLGLKFLQRLLGANRYFDLMRFLAYISSIRVQGSVYREKK